MDRRDRSRKAPSSMAALAAAAAAGEGADSAGAVAHAEEDKKPPKPAGASSSASSAAAGASSSSSPTAAVPVSARKGAAAGGGGGPTCVVERCGADLNEGSRYYRRHKVCEAHAKLPVVVVAGLRQRFCQQCSRFHELSEFDDVKRSCRRRLAGHNERRRKSSADAHGGSGDGCRHADQDGRSHPGNPPLNHFQIR